MKTRILIAALALAFGFSNLAHAGKEEFIHLGHKLKAEFPAVANHSEKKIDTNNGKVTMDIYLASTGERKFLLLVTEMEGNKLTRKELNREAKDFLKGVEESAKNMKVLKEGATDLNKNCPPGYCYLVQHDGGVHLIWLTIENNKIYAVWVSAKSQAELNDEVKAFLASIEIEKK